MKVMKKYGTRMIISMALRNLTRHKVKSALTICAVMVSVSVYIIVDAWLSGINIDSRRNIVNYETGAAKLQTKAYFADKDELPMYESFYDGDKYMKALDTASYNGAPRFVWQGEVLSDNGLSAPFVFYGVNPASEARMLDYSKYIESGRFIKDNNFEVCIGALAAEKLNVQAGDMLRVSAVIDYKDKSGVVRHINQMIDGVSVAGIINCPDPKLNGNIAFMPLDILQDERGMFLEGALTEILIRSKNASPSGLPGKNETPALIKTALIAPLAAEGAVLPDTLDVYNYLDYAADYVAVSRGDDVTTRVMVLFLFVLSFLGIANTMLMSILERTKEIGMMRALGMRDGELYALLMWEAAFIGLIGALFGVIIGCLINIPMVNTGIDFGNITKDLGGDMGYRIVSHYRSVWNVGVIIVSALCAAVLSSLMSVLPVRRALRMPVTNTLRFE